MQWFLYFGLGNTIKKMFCNPEFVKARGRDRNTNDPATFYGSPMARKLNTELRQGLFSPDWSAYTLGFDFVKLFNLRDHSSGIVALRCEDLSPMLRGKKEFTRVVMVIPGPKEPSNVDIYMGMLLREFREYGPDGPGLQVTPLVQADSGRLEHGPTFMHTAVLVGLHADSPARSKAGHFLGAAAYMGCPWCWITGKRVGGTMAYLGYEKDTVVHRTHKKGLVVRMGVNDDERLLTDKDQFDRAAAYITHKCTLELTNQPVPDNLSAFYGVNGYSVFHQQLPYLKDHFNDFWMVPLCHSVFLGLAKDLVRVMTGCLTKHNPPALKLSKQALKRIREREEDFILTTDFNRPYSSFVAANGRYVIEDWARLLLVYSTYLFCPEVNGEEVIGGALKKAWGHLRRFVQYHYAPKNFDREERQRARLELLEYAKILEKECPALCKQNLHVLCCRLDLQEEQRGSVYGELELWIERVVQDVKRKTRYRATTDPEKVAARSITQGTALDLMKIHYPSLRTIDSELQKQKRQSARNPDGFDEEDVAKIGAANADEEMVGLGKRPDAVEWDRLREALGRYLVGNQEPGWSDTDLGDFLPNEPETGGLDVWVHKLARLGKEFVCSEENGRARTRESFHVKIRYKVRGLHNRVVQREYIAKIVKLVRLVKGGRTLRFAICDIYNFLEPFVDDDLGTLYKAIEHKGGPVLAARARTYVNQFQPVLLDTIDTKVYRATIKGDTFDRHYFGTYQFSSGIR